jgi:DNA-binding transcriptional LysR family regulator
MRVVWVAAPGYLARAGVPRTPSDLARHSLVGLSIEGQEPTAWHRAAERSRGKAAARERLVVNKNSVKVAAAVSGQGIARALTYQVTDEVRDGRLRVILARHEPPPVPAHLVHPEGRAASAKVREFLRYSAARLKALPILKGKGLETRR